MSKKNQRVVPHKGGWAVFGEGNKKATRVTRTQQEALRIARQIARNQGTQVVIYRGDGTIRDTESYRQVALPSPPPRIREYQIVEGPFTGTYGEVLIGEHGTLKTRRAIKRLHPHVLRDVIIEEALKQQVVKSPFVIQIYDFFMDERPAIVMEYCPLGLEEHLRDRFAQTDNKIPYDESRELLHNILQGLNDAHTAGLIHGDIKPTNVRFGEHDHLPKLGDFGAARRLRETEAAPVLRGSTNWTAPEVLEGAETTKDSDYFSFGILAYLVLSGCHPFFANDPSCLTSEEDNIRSSTFRPAPLSSLRLDIPEQVAELVMELLSKDQPRAEAARALKVALSQPMEETAQRTMEIPLPPGLPTEDEMARLESAYQRAREMFFVRYRPKQAVEFLEDFLKHFEWERFEGKEVARLADAWSLKAYINNSGGYFQDAVQAAENGLTVQPGHVNSLHARAYAFIQLEEYAAAENDLLTALELAEDPRKRTQVRQLLSTLYQRASP